MRYEVVLQRTVQVTETVDAVNQFMAVLALAEPGDEVVTVTPASRRKAKAGPVRKAAKKRKPLSPEARAKLAQNLVKARAARAAKHKAAKKGAKR